MEGFIFGILRYASAFFIRLKTKHEFRSSQFRVGMKYWCQDQLLQCSAEVVFL